MRTCAPCDGNLTGLRSAQKIPQMRTLLLALLLAGCSRGGAQCLVDAECGAQVCDVEQLVCVDPGAARDLAGQGGDAAAADLLEAPDLRADLATAPPDLACRPEDGYRLCSGSCANLFTSNDHCGACDKPCAGDVKLKFTCCAASCVGLMQDPNNCGGCGKVCPAATSTCCSGVCKLGTSC